ncbi:ABC transporter ATP-binding protein [Halalkalibacter hemicellulosilyticus]|uniref:Nucleoside ABC transporter n=1 Tax=Halalkalibacter hemicellulosilyticusJCM 9152 TaxID=1236971 RepID=W4QK07_9BACI|nr:ABC transporter ATP-binding protein [Halalkalibacter hemicellulosilyticus]GAE32257.1 nucleoside ABC transporter [Halalkalibacter hemicellulosilyticusJCM 9152]
MSTILEMKHMSKKYGEFYANKDISFSLKKGQVHAIIGENGAGKTTLMRMLYGMETPTTGEIWMNGKSVVFSSPSDAINHGIGMVHQHFMLFPYLTVSENIVIGREPKKLGFFQRKEAIKAVDALAEQYRIPLRPKQKVMKCSLGEQQRIEIIKVLYQGADIIVLDEPTAVLTPLEVEGLLKTIRFLASQGKSVIIITHKLQEVMDVADYVTVLRNGEVTGSMPISEATSHMLATLMVGRELKKVDERISMNGERFLELANVRVQENNDKPLLKDVSLHVNRGEIVGIAGVSGNGQSELIQAISGLIDIQKGSIKLDGDFIQALNVKERRDAGIAHIPEDRYKWGVAKDATVEENAIIGFHRKEGFIAKGWIKRKLLRPVIERWVTQYSIKTSSIKEEASNLSGGNLQKLIVARELGQNTPFLIAAEPTRGVDIGAMEVIHDSIIQKRNDNGSVLLVSSELTEIMKLSDRILVMYEGEIVGEMSRSEATEEKLSILMAGGNLEDALNEN